MLFLDNFWTKVLEKTQCRKTNVAVEGFYYKAVVRNSYYNKCRQTDESDQEKHWKKIH